MKRGHTYIDSKEKRAFDLLVVSISAVPAAIGAAAAAVALGIEMKRWPVFTQNRVGQSDEQLMPVTKLLTLKGDPEQNRDERGGPNSINHQRASGVGKVVRRLHADEALQLPSVLGGKMAIVGPRPIIPVEHEAVIRALDDEELTAAYRNARSQCKPGIVEPDGHSKHTKSGLSDRQRGLSTIQYSKEASLSVDIHHVLMALGWTARSSLEPFTEKAASLRNRSHDAATLAVVAESLGVTLTDREKFENLMRARVACTIDDIVDDDIPPEHQREVFTRFFSDEKTCESAPAWLSENQRYIEELIAHLQGFKTRRQNVTTIEDYAGILTEESNVFASLFELEEHDDETRRKFNDWLGHFSRGGYYLDSALDMKRDYGDGNLSLPPSLAGQKYLLMLAIKEAGHYLRVARHKAVAQELARLGLVLMAQSTKS